jgi:large subunit ribosomal protein L22
MANETAHMAAANGFNLPVSTKFSIEVAKFIRGKNLQKAKKLMQGVLKKEVAVPFRRYNRDQAHKTGIGPGRYPIKVANTFLSLLEAAEANAANKGLDVESLYVKAVMANKGTGTMRASRHRGRSAKRTHIELVLEEKETPKKKAVKKTKKEPKAKKKEGKVE